MDEKDGLRSLVEASKKYGMVCVSGQDEEGEDLFIVIAATSPTQIKQIRYLMYKNERGFPDISVELPE